MLLAETAAACAANASVCAAFGCWTDGISKAVAAISVVCGGWWPVRQYFVARRQEAKTAAIAAQQPFLAKRLDLYAEATSCAGTIAGGGDAVEVAKATEQFWMLFWGPMALVEDEQVAGAMGKFGGALRDGRQSMLPLLSIDLSHKCRDSIAESWMVALPKTKAETRESSLRTP